LALASRREALQHLPVAGIMIEVNDVACSWGENSFGFNFNPYIGI